MQDWRRFEIGRPVTLGEPIDNVTTGEGTARTPLRAVIRGGGASARSGVGTYPGFVREN